jgi:Mor family transcriptional regulator
MDKYNCLYCNKEVINRNSKKKFCRDKNCQTNYKYEQFIESWKRGEESGCDKAGDLKVRIRRYIFEKFDSKCCKCGWNEVNEHTGKTPLQIDHIDGNCKNNTEDNLRLLCPNCHSLTGTYGALNKGNGREQRRKKRRKKYNKDELSCLLCGDEIYLLSSKQLCKKCYDKQIINYCDCGKLIDKDAKRCKSCSDKHQQKVERPPYHILLKEVEETSYVAVGKKYDVTDNAIRKWIKYYEKHEGVVK